MIATTVELMIMILMMPAIMILILIMIALTDGMNEDIFPRANVGSALATHPELKLDAHWMQITKSRLLLLFLEVLSGART